MYKIWLILDRYWATGVYYDLDEVIRVAEDIPAPCVIQEFTNGRYVSILEFNK